MDLDQGMEHLCGWVEDHPNREIVASSMPSLFEAAPHLFGGALPENVLLYRAFKDALGDYLPYIAQETGDCTSFGMGHGCDLAQCVDIALGHKPKDDFHETCTEAIYAMGREIGGMLGGGAGCVGAYVAKAVVKGIIDRKSVGDYTGERAKDWGRHGLPEAVKTMMAKGGHAVKAVAKVSTFDDLMASLAASKPVAVCSDYGFSMVRDENGMCFAKGEWAHCMLFVGYRTRNNLQEACIFQSWGPNTPSGPLIDDQPNNSFWVSKTTAAGMLAAQDSWAIAGVNGWSKPSLPVSWTTQGWAL